MGASFIAARLTVLVLFWALSVNCCLRLDRWIKAGTCLDFSEIKEKFLEGDDISIKDEACLFQEFKSPSLKDLGDMFNDVLSGTVPQYIQDNDYNFIGKVTGGYSYSYGNIGTLNGSSYGVFQKDGDMTTLRTLKFKFIQGSVGTFNYSAGQALFTYVRYAKTDKALTFEAATLGSLLFKMPQSDEHVVYGNHTLLSDGEFKLHGETLSNSLDTVSILNIPTQYYSRDISHFSGESNSRNSSQKFNIYSLTGGTNSTLVSYNLQPVKDAIRIGMEGTLVDSEREVSLEGWVEMSLPFDTTNPFSDKSLPFLFGIVRAGVGLYLPRMP